MKPIKFTKDNKAKDADSPLIKAGESIIDLAVWDDLVKEKGTEKKLLDQLGKVKA